MWIRSYNCYGNYIGLQIILDEVAFKIEVIEKSGEVTSPHPAGFGRARARATKRSAPAAAARHLLGARRSAI